MAVAKLLLDFTQTLSPYGKCTLTDRASFCTSVNLMASGTACARFERPISDFEGRVCCPLIGVHFGNRKHRAQRSLVVRLLCYVNPIYKITMILRAFRLAKKPFYK